MRSEPEYGGSAPADAATMSVAAVVQFNPANPYVGPQPFDRGRRLYGRDEETETVLNMVRSQRIVLLHSLSGVGKTSLIQSAVVPILEAEDYDVLPVVRVGEPVVGPPDTRPRNRYLHSALSSLAAGSSIPAGQETLRQALTAHRAREGRGSDWMQLLLFDQFEEVFSLDPADLPAKREFFQELGLTLRDEQVAAIFLLREEYLGELEQYTAALPTRLTRRYRLEPLGRAQAIQAIQGPAAEHGVRFRASAAEKLIDDLAQGTGIGPDGSILRQHGGSVEAVLLQLACFDTWERKRPAWRDLPERTIEPEDVSTESLGRYYASQVKEAAARSGVTEEELRDWVATRLITPGGLRSQALDEGQSVAGLSRRAAEELSRGLIVRKEIRGGRTWFELSHDRFIAPVRTDNEHWFQEEANWLRRAAEKWRQGLRNPGDLLDRRGRERGAQERARRPLSQIETEFLEASLRQSRKKARLVAAAVIGVGLILIVTWYWGRTVGISDYRWLARQSMDLQSELQARTYAEIPTETPAEEEISWPRWSMRTGVPSIAPSPRFDDRERAVQRALAQERLSELSPTTPLAGIPVRLEGSGISVAARTRLRNLGATLSEPSGRRLRPNSLTVNPNVPIEAVRAVALTLAAAGTPVSRIRVFRNPAPPPGMVLEHITDLEVWAPLTVEQIMRLSTDR